MPLQPLIVTIPTPCPEDWDSMTAQSQGKFCQSCQKVVVDFTVMSDAEVVAWLAKEQESTCGRFRQNQLSRELTALPPSATRPKQTWQAIFLGLAAWLTSKTALAQQPSQTTAQHTSPTIPSPQNKAPLPDGALQVSGVVLDRSTKEAVPGVTVQFTGTTLATITAVDGSFTFMIPASAIQNATTAPSLTFFFLGMATEVKLLQDLHLDKPNRILLRQELPPGECVVVVAGMVHKVLVPRPPGSPNLIQRLKNRFYPKTR